MPGPHQAANTSRNVDQSLREPYHEISRLLTRCLRRGFSDDRMSRIQPQSADQEESLGQFAATTAATARRVPAWLMSSVLHLLAMLVLAFVIRDTSGGAAVEAQRTGGIVLVQQSDGTTEYLSEEDVEPASESQAEVDQSSEVAAALPSAAEFPVDLAGSLPSNNELEGIGAGGDLGDALPSAGDLTSGTGPSKKIGGDTKTYVFGVEGEGTVFLYVFDRSSSMSGFQGRPLAAAKSELMKSLQSLTSTNQFQIIFYNNRVSVFNPYDPQQPRLMFGDDGNKAMAEQFVRQIMASGGTSHMEPLRLALRLAPDVIFFLTDAADPQLSPGQLRELNRLNSGTVVNTIEFGSGPFPGGDNFLQKLARQNDGQHVYVDVAKLPFR